MTTPSGQISLANVNTELGLAATTLISMNQSNVRTLAGVGGSGTVISMQNLQNKSNAFAFSATISGNTTDYNLRNAAIAAGWNQTTALVATITINSGVTVVGGSTGSPAFNATGSWPAGSSLALTNGGVILGRGGQGGNYNAGGYGPAEAGSSGGPALSVTIASTVTNNNRIAGGGGGGGGCGAFVSCYCSCSGTYGNLQFGATGGGGIGNGPAGTRNIGGASLGSAGTLTSPGNGVNVGFGASGNGGTYGSSGAGSTGSSNYGNNAGGAAGAAVVGNSNITWVAFGTRNGAIT